MKNIIALLLAIVLCLSLCACGGDSDTAITTDAIEQDNIDILGKWVWVGDKSNTITFNEDGTCQYSSGHNAKYSVNYDLSIITIHDTFTSNYNIVNENGIIKLSSSADYVREENYANAHIEYVAAENAQKQLKIDEFFSKGKENREELVFGKSYALNETTNITFQTCSLGIYDEQEQHYLLDFTIVLENNSENKICIRGGYDGKKGYKSADIEALVDSVVLDRSEITASLYIVLSDDTNNSTLGKPIYLEPNSVGEYSATISNFSSYTLYPTGEYAIENHQQYIIITCADKELFLNVTDLIDQTK